MKSKIAEFYAGQSVFITGATGFIGKILVHKLLRSCPDIAAIYVLIRAKKGKSPKQRLESLFQTKLFEGLHSSIPNFPEKVIPVLGDIKESGLGLSNNHLALLIANVSIVFHSAATVRFDEPIRQALQMNLVAVQEVMGVASQMPKLKAIVHVSTAYANCDKMHIAEVVYPPPVQPEKLLTATEWMDDEMLNAVTPCLIRPRPNTYTYTKALAEYMIAEKCTDLPCAIVRPSIVGATWSDPFPGWVDNFNGPTGILAAIGKGMLRVMKGNFDGIADIIPADIVANLLIVVAWNIATNRPNKLKVYNCTSGQLNKLTWGQVERGSCHYFFKHPVDDVMRVPNPRFTNSRLWHDVNLWVDQLIPCWIMDFYLSLVGKPPIFQKVQSRLHKNVTTLDYFTRNEWVFVNDNIMALQKLLSSEDRKMFNFDVRPVDWDLYLENYCLGVKQYVLKEDLQSISKAKERLVMLQKRNQFVTMLLALLFSQMLLLRFQTPKNLLTAICRRLLALLKFSIQQVSKTAAIK